jgi:hypothetical protein
MVREEESPATNGKWRYEWQADLHKYVKPDYVAAVTVMLNQKAGNLKEAPQMSDVVSTKWSRWDLADMAVAFQAPCRPVTHTQPLYITCRLLQMLKQLRSAAQEGFWAFCQVATLG